MFTTICLAVATGLLFRAYKQRDAAAAASMHDELHDGLLAMVEKANQREQAALDALEDTIKTLAVTSGLLDKTSRDLDRAVSALEHMETKVIPERIMDALEKDRARFGRKAG